MYLTEYWTFYITEQFHVYSKVWKLIVFLNICFFFLGILANMHICIDLYTF